MRHRTLALFLITSSLLAPAAWSAQETPTERAAARDVLKKIAALEQSVDVPAIVARLTGPNADRDQVVARAKDLVAKELLARDDDIATHRKIGFEERRSVGNLVEYLQKHDFSVEAGSADLFFSSIDAVRPTIPPEGARR